MIWFIIFGLLLFMFIMNNIRLRSIIYFFLCLNIFIIWKLLVFRTFYKIQEMKSYGYVLFKFDLKHFKIMSD